MQIKQFRVNNLFGNYTYEFDFSKLEDSVAILTAPNGYGKTTLLKIFSALNPKNLFYFYNLKFDEMTFLFDDKTSLKIKKERVVVPQNDDINGDDDTISEDVNVRFEWYKDQAKITSLVLNRGVINKSLRSLSYKDFRYPRNISLLSEEQRRLYLEANETFITLIANDEGAESFLMQLRQLSTCYIPVNRIFESNRDADGKLPINSVKEKLEVRLSELRKQYLLSSQKEDNLFSTQILSPLKEEISEDEYSQGAEELNHRVKLYSEYISECIVNIPEYSKEKSEILFCYLEHLKQKLHSCDAEIDKLRLFMELLSSKHLSHKQVQLSTLKGFRVVSDKGERLDLATLSSGEQNEIVLTYYMVFEVPNGGILLIDEPENSLHVAWQNLFVDELTKLATVKGIQVFIATHSPTIVGNGFQNSIDLFYLNEKHDS